MYQLIYEYNVYMFDIIGRPQFNIHCKDNNTVDFIHDKSHLKIHQHVGVLYIFSVDATGRETVPGNPVLSQNALCRYYFL